MKTSNLKFIAYALSALMLMSSCRVYHSRTSTVDEAVMSQKRVKVKDHKGVTYKFEMFQKENEQLFGIIKKKNQTMLNNCIKQFGQGKIVDSNVKFLIPDNTFKEYYLQDKTKSTVFTVVLTVGISVVIIGLIVAISFAKQSEDLFVK